MSATITQATAVLGAAFLSGPDPMMLLLSWRCNLELTLDQGQ